MMSSLFLSKSVRLLLSALLALSATVALAQNAEPGAGQGAGKNFEEHKQKELARIAQHLQMMQTLQSCVQAATDHAAIKSCNEAAKAARGPER